MANSSAILTDAFPPGHRGSAFAQGLSAAFGFAVAAWLIAALASLLRGGRFVYGEPADTVEPPGQGTAADSASPAFRH
jgi:ABC-type thiamin/hydroxymethylpyrimidine transport system permease subunit